MYMCNVYIICVIYGIGIWLDFGKKMAEELENILGDWMEKVFSCIGYDMKLYL